MDTVFRAAASLAVACSTGLAVAGEVPASALSHSLSMEPILLDHSSLVFQFPQLAAGADTARSGFGRLAPRSMLFAYAAQETGLGAVLRRARFGGFVLSQASMLSRALDAQGVRFHSRSSVLQAGVAAGWRGWRIGTALRGSRDRQEGGSRGLSQGASSLSDDTDVGDFLEGAFGAGTSLGGAHIDVCLEVQRETYDLGTAVLGPADTLLAQLTAENPDAIRAVARIAAPLGRGLRLVAAGAYRGGELHWNGLQYESDRLTLLDFVQGQSGWMAAAALEMPASFLERAAVSGAYKRSRAVLAGTDDSSGVATAERFTEYAQVAVSGQRALWHELELQAAAGTTYERTRRDERQVGRGLIRSQGQRDEALRGNFAWGLSYGWRNLEFAAALDARLRPTEVFAYLDIHLGL
jgi:hypothetical protein